jgi:hypothetical protein
METSMKMMNDDSSSQNKTIKLCNKLAKTCSLNIVFEQIEGGRVPRLGTDALCIK